MSELRLDYQPNTPIPWSGIVMLGVAVTALVLTGTYYYKLTTQVATWEAKVGRIQDKGAQHASAGRSSERGAADLAQEVNNANDVLRHLGVPWESLFQAVEAAGNQNITLLAIEPDIEKQQVKISGEAKDFNALMNYITHLQGQAVFGLVYLQTMMFNSRILTNLCVFHCLRLGGRSYDAQIESFDECDFAKVIQARCGVSGNLISRASPPEFAPHAAHVGLARYRCDKYIRDLSPILFFDYPSDARTVGYVATYGKHIARANIARRQYSPRSKYSKRGTRGVLQTFSSGKNFPHWMGTLVEVAEKNGLSLNHGEYVVTQDKVGQLRRFKITLPVQGSYQQVRKFLSALNYEVPMVALENVQFERKDILDTDLQVKIRLMLYMVQDS